VWLFTCKFELTTSGSTSMLFYSSDNCSSHEGLPSSSFFLVFSACISHVCSQLVLVYCICFPTSPVPIFIKAGLQVWVYTCHLLLHALVGKKIQFAVDKILKFTSFYQSPEENTRFLNFNSIQTVALVNLHLS